MINAQEPEENIIETIATQATVACREWGIHYPFTAWQSERWWYCTRLPNDEILSINDEGCGFLEMRLPKSLRVIFQYSERMGCLRYLPGDHWQDIHAHLLILNAIPIFTK